MDRATFEELAAEGLGAIEAVLKECLDASGWTPDDVYAVEIVGGSTRIPAIKNRIQVWSLTLYLFLLGFILVESLICLEGHCSLPFIPVT